MFHPPAARMPCLKHSIQSFSRQDVDTDAVRQIEHCTAGVPVTQRELPVGRSSK